MRDNLPGCALVVLFCAVVTLAVTLLNWYQAGEDLRRLPGMRKVPAVVTDKGIAVYEHKDQRPGRLGNVTKDVSYWIRFECRVDGAVKEGTRLSLFRLDDASLWNRFDKGRPTEAFYDPGADECILVVDQPPGGARKPSAVGLFLSGGTAALALVVFLLTRRRSVTAPEMPPPAGA